MKTSVCAEAVVLSDCISNLSYGSEDTKPTISVAVLDANRWFANVGLLVFASVKKTPFRAPSKESPAPATPIVPVFNAFTGS